VQEYEARKLILAEKIANRGRPIKGYEESFRTSLEFPENPQKIWISERLENKRAVLKLAFVGHLSYQRNEGFRTPEISLLFKALDGFLGPKKTMVHRAVPGERVSGQNTRTHPVN
jgi:site-specific DNA recombinase